MNLQIDIQVASDEPAPDEDDIRSWIETALAHNKTSLDEPAEISLRIVDEPEMSRLNRQYRGKSGSTNVLSFPADIAFDIGIRVLGDIVICAPVVHEEARQQNKPERAHWSHMVVHGTLHLLGHDHIQPDDAEIMESLETRILASMGFDCPYSTTTQVESAAL